MKRSLMNEISVTELLTMRETGMSNYEIAQSLEVSEPTIYRLIGKNPKGTPRRRRTPDIVEKPIMQPQTAPEEIEACLAVQYRNIECTGSFGIYAIDCQKRQVYASYGDGKDFVVSFDKLGDLVKELTAIHRQIDNLKTKQELW